MTDFEHRLTDALTSGAEEAPDPDRLVAGAHTRAKSRKRTRYAAVAGLVVVALAVPVGVLALNDDGDGSRKENRIATDPPEEAPSAWQTVEHEGALVEVPGNWERLDTSSCEFQRVRFGPRNGDPCLTHVEGLSFYGSATFDPAHGPGVVTGGAGLLQSAYVYAGEWVIYAQMEDPIKLRQVLGSAREVGEEPPDLSAGFRTESEGGLAIDVPKSWKEGALANWCLDKSVRGRVERPGTRALLIHCSPETGYGIRFGAGRSGDWIRERSGPEYPEGSWAGVAIAPDANGKPVGFVQVVAPTQALADLIGGSLTAE